MTGNIWGMAGNREQEHQKQGTYATCKNSGILSSSVFTPHPCPSKKTCLNRVIVSLQSGSSVSTTTLQLLLSDVITEADNGATNEDHKADNEAIYQLRISAILYIHFVYIHIYISAIQDTTYIDISSNLTHQIPFQS